MPCVSPLAPYRVRGTARACNHVAHVGKTSPVTKGSDARAIFAQSCGYPSSRVPQWLLEPLQITGTLATLWRVCAVTCLRHSSNGRPRTGTRKFTQEHVLSDVRRRTRWATSLGSRGRPHDSGSGPRMPRKSSASRARPTLLEHPSVSSTVTVGDDIMADGVSLLKVGSGMVRTYYEPCNHRFITQSNYRNHRGGLEWLY